MEVEGFVYAQRSIDEAKQCWKEIEPFLKGDSGSWDPVYTNPTSIPSNPLTASVVLEWLISHKGNPVVVALNVGECNSETWGAQHIVRQIMKDEFFAELRTKQQTAYSLDDFSRSFQGDLFQLFSLESGTHGSEDLCQTIELFLDFFGKNFSKVVSRDRIKMVGNALIAEAKKFEGKNPDQAKIWICALERVSDREVDDMAINIFSLNNRKRLAVLVKGQPID